MIKNYNKFIKESVENKGKGLGGSQDLFPSAPFKQTKNRSIPTMDFLRIGKHIKSGKIDGFIDSVQNESIYISDRMTGEIMRYSLKEVLKELTQYKDKFESEPIQGFEGTPKWATKQNIYEGYEPERERQREFEPDEQELEQEQEQELEYGDEEEPDEIEIGSDEEEDGEEVQPQNFKNNAERMKLMYGTEDNPEGLPNKGSNRDMPNESWVNIWGNFDQKQRSINESLEEEDEEEDEVPFVRGTEDNPLPDRRRKTKIENY